MDTPTTITCVECGGTAHLVSYPPEQGFSPGDVVAFVCDDCNHRHDLVFGGDDDPSDR